MHSPGLRMVGVFSASRCNSILSALVLRSCASNLSNACSATTFVFARLFGQSLLTARCVRGWAWRIEQRRARVRGKVVVIRSFHFAATISFLQAHIPPVLFPTLLVFVVCSLRLSMHPAQFLLRCRLAQSRFEAMCYCFQSWSDVCLTDGRGLWGAWLNWLHVISLSCFRQRSSQLSAILTLASAECSLKSQRTWNSAFRIVYSLALLCALFIQFKSTFSFAIAASDPNSFLRVNPIDRFPGVNCGLRGRVWVPLKSFSSLKLAPSRDYDVTRSCGAVAVVSGLKSARLMEEVALKSVSQKCRSCSPLCLCATETSSKNLIFF